MKLRMILPSLLALFLALRPSRAQKVKCSFSDVYNDKKKGFSVPASCEKLAFGGAKLGDEGCISLAAALQEAFNKGGLRNVRELHLPTTEITGVCMKAICDFLLATGADNSLRVLNLYGNQLLDGGAIQLARLFADDNANRIPLETLGLGVNAIGPAGAAALANALGSCPSCPLKTLGLYRNAVGDEGAAALAEHLVAPNQISLHSLFLGGNDIGDRGAQALAAGLRSNTKLEILSLEGGSIGDDGAVALGAALGQSTSAITSLDIRSCLPTHRNCFHSHLSEEEAAATGAAAAGESERGHRGMTKAGISALKRAVAVRDGALKVTGDVVFGGIKK